jgi:hypothetical protein
MADESVPRVRFRYKSWITVGVLLTVGLVLLIASQSITLPATGLLPFFKVFLEHLATALLAGACISGVYEYFLRMEFLDSTREQTDELKKALQAEAQESSEVSSRSHKEIVGLLTDLKSEALQEANQTRDVVAASLEQRELGISHCFLEVDRYEYARVIVDSDNLIAVMNDGRGLITNNYEKFVRRFARNGCTTAIILMHPNSEALKLHAAKVGSTPEGIRIKIAETIDYLKRANAERSELKILGHDLYTTMSVFLTEHEAVITPYFLSKVRRTPPLFTFVDSGVESFYNKLSEDVKALMVDCTDISSYTARDGSQMP